MALKVELVLTVYKQENDPKKKKKNSVEIKIQKDKKFQNFKINKKNKIWFAKDCKCKNEGTWEEDIESIASLNFHPMY